MTTKSVVLMADCVSRVERRRVCIGSSVISMTSSSSSCCSPVLRRFTGCVMINSSVLIAFCVVRPLRRSADVGVDFEDGMGLVCVEGGVDGVASVVGAAPAASAFASASQVAISVVGMCVLLRVSAGSVSISMSIGFGSGGRSIAIVAVAGMSENRRGSTHV